VVGESLETLGRVQIKMTEISERSLNPDRKAFSPMPPYRLSLWDPASLLSRKTHTVRGECSPMC
jgi:hypothetical protein